MNDDPTPPDADYAARIAASFARQGLMAHLGVSIARLGPGLCDLVLPFRAEVTQQNGWFHGGAIAAVGDVAGGYAAATMMPAGTGVLTVEFKINMLSPAQGDSLLASGRVVRTGRTLSVVTVEVRSVSGDRTKLCAVMQQTLMAVEGRTEVG